MSYFNEKFERDLEEITLGEGERALMLASLRAHQKRHPLGVITHSRFSAHNFRLFTRLTALAFVALISIGTVSYVANQNGVPSMGSVQSIIIPNNAPASSVKNTYTKVFPTTSNQKLLPSLVSPLSDKSMNATPSFMMMKIMATTSATSTATTTEDATSTLK